MSELRNTVNVPATGERPEIEALWIWSDPAESERRFREVLPRFEQAGDAEGLAQLLTQLGRALVLLRRYAEAEETFAEAARLLSDRTPIARLRYLLEQGRLHNDLGRTAAAREAFEEVYAAASATGRGDLAFDAAHMLGVLEPAAGAVAWGARAIRSAEASDDPRVRRWLGTLRMNYGVKLLAVGRPQEAEQAFAAAAEFFAASGQAGRLRVARVGMARAVREGGNPAAALPKAFESLADLQAADEPPGYAFEEIAENLLALGRPVEAQGYFAQAHAALAADPWFPPTEADRLERLRRLGEK